jgi:hypothetical protein
MTRTTMAGWLLLLAVAVHAGDDAYSVATLEAIPMGMGGAVSARLGGLESVFYNPATFTHKTPRLWEEGLELTVFTNPAGAIAYGAEAIQGDPPPGNPGYDVPMVFLRGVNLAYKPFHIGTVLAEEELLPIDDKPDQFFDLDRVPNNRRLAGYINLVLSRRVRVGASVTGFFRERQIKQYASTYGLYLTPSRFIQVGVFFCDLPEFHADSTFTGTGSFDEFEADEPQTEPMSVRRPYAGLEDESVNLGMALRVNRDSRIMLDLRNVFIEDASRDIEVRVGAEGRVNDHVIIRAGAVPSTEEGDHLVTWGVGLLDMHRFGEQIGLYETDGMFLNYAMVYRFGRSGRDRAHFLTLTWELGK